jgi:hypothetical protein
MTEIRGQKSEISKSSALSFSAEAQQSKKVS